MLEIPLLNLVTTRIYQVKESMDVEAEFINAVREGNIEAVDFLLCPGEKSRCADINARNGEALVTAVKNEDFKMVEFLLSRGADIHASEETFFSYDRERALQAAVETGNFEMVELLLSHGANPKEAESYYEHEGGGRIHDVLSNAKDPRILALLFSYGAHPDNNFRIGYITAIEEGDLEKVKLFHAYGVTSYDYDLVRAADKGRISIMRYLISQGKDPSRWFQSAHDVHGPYEQVVVELLTDIFNLPDLEAKYEEELRNLKELRALVSVGNLGSMIARYL